MGERWKHWLLPWYNRKAQQITDPVQRLRYLRTVGANSEEILKPLHIPWARIGAGVALAAIAAILFFRTGGSVRAVGKAPPKGPRPSREYVLDPLTANEQKVWLHDVVTREDCSRRCGGQAWAHSFPCMATTGCTPTANRAFIHKLGECVNLLISHFLRGSFMSSQPSIVDPERS